MYLSAKKLPFGLREGCALLSKLKNAFLTVGVWIAVFAAIYLLIMYESLRVILGVIVILAIAILGSSALKRGYMTLAVVLVIGMILIWLFGL